MMVLDFTQGLGFLGFLGFGFGAWSTVIPDLEVLMGGCETRW